VAYRCLTARGPSHAAPLWGFFGMTIGPEKGRRLSTPIPWVSPPSLPFRSLWQRAEVDHVGEECRRGRAHSRNGVTPRPRGRPLLPPFRAPPLAESRRESWSRLRAARRPPRGCARRTLRPARAPAPRGAGRCPPR